MSGHVGDLSTQQTKTLIAFQTVHPNVSVSSCLRFLRAREFDLVKALSLFEAQQRLRDKYGLDTVLERPPTQLLNMHAILLPHAFHGFDKEGRPIYVLKAGSIHADLLATHVGVDEVCIFRLS